MRFSVCNEMFGETPFDEVCRIAAAIGYEGVEIAPFTLADDVRHLDGADRAEIRRTAERHGLAVAGIHWLLVKPEGLHMTTPDDAVRERTRDYLLALVDFCADLGGELLVCGSPKQRTILDDPAATRQRAVDLFRSVADRAGERDVSFCIEPLAPTETDFLNTAAEGAAMVEAVGHPSFRLILDVKAMSGAEAEPLPEVIRRHARILRHFHANDPNLLGPGMGEFDQAPLGAALRAIDYPHWVSVEVFRFELGGETLARQSFETLLRDYRG